MPARESALEAEAASSLFPFRDALDKVEEALRCQAKGYDPASLGLDVLSVQSEILLALRLAAAQEAAARWVAE